MDTILSYLQGILTLFFFSLVTYIVSILITSEEKDEKEKKEGKNEKDGKKEKKEKNEKDGKSEIMEIKNEKEDHGLIDNWFQIG